LQLHELSMAQCHSLIRWESDFQEQEEKKTFSFQNCDVFESTGQGYFQNFCNDRFDNGVR
jgi:hypothetical protein